MKKAISIIVILTLLACALCACLPQDTTPWIRIDVGESKSIYIGESFDVIATKSDNLIGYFNWRVEDTSIVSIKSSGAKCTIEGKKGGSTDITVAIGDYTATFNLTVLDTITVDEEATITLSCAKDEIFEYGIAILNYAVTPTKYTNFINFRVVEGDEYVDVVGSTIKAISEGSATIVAYIDEYESNEIEIDILEYNGSDPFIDVAQSDFYKDYTPAVDYIDAQLRAKHGFMAGDITTPVAEPTLAQNQPKDNGTFLKNSSHTFEDNGNTYLVINENGEVINKIYKGGGYISLDEVAAYLTAYCDVPVNYDANKNAVPSQSIWGKYLRVNHTKFSGNTYKYPYEPELPNISGCGGNIQYMELDIGTTGTDTGGGYPVKTYNNGQTITRGAARIVYTNRYTSGLNANQAVEIENRRIFYTYNHYNDFQEYLNYKGGWGEIFGNATGGGQLSSKYDYNPTPYVEVEDRDFTTCATTQYVSCDIAINTRDEDYLIVA